MVFKIFAMALVAAAIVFIVHRASRARPQRADVSSPFSDTYNEPIFGTVDPTRPDESEDRGSSDGDSDGHSDTGGGSDGGDSRND